MKYSPMSIIARFCQKHPNFGIPNLMMYVIGGNILVYLLVMMSPNNNFLYALYFNWDLILQGQVWRLITYIFIPPTWSLFSFLISLYFYYIIAKILEMAWGTAKFSFYYFFGVILTTLYGIIISLAMDASYVGISSYYLNLSLFFAYATLFPDNIVLLFFIIPIKMKYLALFDGILFIAGILSNPFPLNLFPLVPILNYLIFCYGDLRYAIKGNVSFNKMKYSKSASHFRQETRKTEKQQSNVPYRHKCAVCGRTDAEYPHLQFRYCSKCAGYHCFCEDHINNHIHFTE